MKLMVLSDKEEFDKDIKKGNEKKDVGEGKWYLGVGYMLLTYRFIIRKQHQRNKI